MRRILFICKHRSSYGISFGLLNSAKFVADVLNKLDNVQAKVIDVVDHNQIDREVHRFKPTHVIIEALWVVPGKFPELLKLHQDVMWYVRVHSKPTFIANEGIAMEWLAAYADIEDNFDNFGMMINDAEFAKVLAQTFSSSVEYAPNIYTPICRQKLETLHCNKYIHIGCFGAIRPMKNHLAQALAAIKFAEERGKVLIFHINSDRVEQRGNEVLKNLRALFDRTVNSILVEHSWSDHEQFLELVRAMDLGMQVSLSETFNIVTADFVSLGIPIVVCSDIDWAPSLYHAHPSSIESMSMALHRLWGLRHWGITMWARFGLWRHNRKALRQWKKALGV